jgi:hypothetical protein
VAALRRNTHSYTRVTTARVQVSDVTAITGWNSPFLGCLLSEEWYIALGQNELAAAFSGSMAATKGFAQEAAPEVESSETNPPKDPPPAAEDLAEREFVPILGSTFSRHRWQTVLAFALEHVVHSRALDEIRNGQKALLAEDQVRLLAWLYLRTNDDDIRLALLEEAEAGNEDVYAFLSQSDLLDSASSEGDQLSSSTLSRPRDAQATKRSVCWG